MQDVTSIDGNSVTRPIYSGKAMETLTVADDTILTLRPNTFAAAADGGSAEVSTVNQSADVATSVKEAIAKASERLDVADADIVISGGRGMGSIDNFSHLEAIADQLGAAVGASRAVVDGGECLTVSKLGKPGRLSILAYTSPWGFRVPSNILQACVHQSTLSPSTRMQMHPFLVSLITEL